MGLTSVVIKSGASAMAPTGGTDETFTPDGQTVANGLHVIDANVADFRIRPHGTFKYKAPTLMNGKYSKAKNNAVLVQPVILASGETVFNVGRLEFEIHPETSVADALNLRFRTLQMGSAASTASFWATGSTA